MLFRVASSTTPVDENLTQRIAHLARLELTDDEVRLYANQLGRVLDYVQSLQAVEVTGVKPFLSPVGEASGDEAADQGSLLREDSVIPSAPGVLECAPEVLDHGVKVPPIL